MVIVCKRKKKKGVTIEKRFYSRSRAVFMQADNEPVDKYLYVGVFCWLPHCVMAQCKTCESCRHNVKNLQKKPLKNS